MASRDVSEDPGGLRKKVQGKDNVLTALTTAASGLRSKLGESQASLKTYDAPLTQATTSSLEALQAFSRGGVELNAFRFPSSATHLEHAVELDEDFAVTASRDLNFP